ncbi:MAG: site-specific DNA-methyltransferase, partial [Magnetococcales bacterium]|nr:site-specific DNA-methyltransferase [Magnetococcales bacterium]
MKKLTANDPAMQSADLLAENVERLKALFPEAFTEGGIDFSVLRELLGGYVDEREEKYGLNWNGKRQARRLALTPSTGTLRPCPEESVDWETTQNLIIEGDNLEVLKLLQKSYAGLVKLIYIDPPYNTGKDFVYSDDFRDNIRNYLELTGQTDGEGRPFSSNTETSGRFHTDWLNMMYPRLRLARNLLREDGVILISIDDVEIDNARAQCSDIFGEENFVACLVWEKGRKNDAKLFSLGHDYILVFARSKAYLTMSGIKWREAKPGAAEIQDEYLKLRAIHGNNNEIIQEELRRFFNRLAGDHPSKRLRRYSNVDNQGVWRDDNMSWPGGGGPNYDVIHPVTGLPCKVPDGGWRYSTKEKMEEMIASGRVMFRVGHSEPPIRKTYLVREDDDSLDDSNDDVGVQVAGTYFYRSALQASNVMLDLFGKKIFDNPKDHEVLARLINYICCGREKEVILDFFAGSGTTAHAVLDLNKKDGGNRRFILVQLQEPTGQKEYPTIADICKERVRRVIGKFNAEDAGRLDLHAGRLDLSEGVRQDRGFRVFKLDTSNLKPWDPAPEDLNRTLLDHVDHILPDRSEQDLLFELLLKLGLELT